MKYNATSLQKFENVLQESEYVLRYERGNFQSGYCILENRKVIVLNKFLNVEGRINTMIELIPQLQITYDKLTRESQKVFDGVMKQSEIVFEPKATPE